MHKDTVKKQLKKPQQLSSVMRYERFVQAKDYVVIKLVKKNVDSYRKYETKFEIGSYRDVEERR